MGIQRGHNFKFVEITNIKMLVALFVNIEY